MAYTYGDSDDADDPWVVPVVESARNKTLNEISYYMDGAADALTVGSATLSNDEESEDNHHSNENEVDETSSEQPIVSQYETISDSTPEQLKSMYEAIQASKSKQKFILTEDNSEKKLDPGFRIYHVDEATGNEFEIPPYTSPGEFLALLEQNGSIKTAAIGTKPAISGDSSDADEPDETTYDGYQAIQQSNSREYRQDELDVMREARRKNRMGQTEIDYSKIGAQPMHDMSS
jgi:hypothetical protein